MSVSKRSHSDKNKRTFLEAISLLVGQKYILLQILSQLLPYFMANLEKSMILVFQVRTTDKIYYTRKPWLKGL